MEGREYGKAEKYVVKKNLISLIRSITLIVNLKASFQLLYFHLHIDPSFSTSLRKKSVGKIKNELNAVPHTTNPFPN